MALRDYLIITKAHLVIQRILVFIIWFINMAIFHCSATTISRSSGRSACAAAAYRAAVSIKDERTDITYDFTRKGGVIYSEIVTPAVSPAWASNRPELWNRAEKAEDASTRRAAATTAREFNIALPYELDTNAQIASAREFARYIVSTYAVVVDFSIHKPNDDGDKRNYHGHFMLTDRRITDLGFTDKVRELNIFNGGKAHISSIRAQWARIANHFLELAGVHASIDHRSYQAQGLDLEATTHLGVAAAAIELRGEMSKRGDLNRAAKSINVLRAELKEAGETMRTLEFVEMCDGTEDVNLSDAESRNISTVISGCSESVSMSAEKCREFLHAANVPSLDSTDMSERTPDSNSKEAGLSGQQKLDPQKLTQDLKLSATKITFEEWIKEPETQGKDSKERSRMLMLSHPSRGRDR